jgi:hypothetical protein
MKHFEKSAKEYKGFTKAYFFNQLGFFIIVGGMSNGKN